MRANIKNENTIRSNIFHVARVIWLLLTERCMAWKGMVKLVSILPQNICCGWWTSYILKPFFAILCGLDTGFFISKKCKKWSNRQRFL